MQITFEALELAFKPIEEVGLGEIEFEVNGTTITLRRLLPEEDAEVQKFAAGAAKSEDDSKTVNAMEFLERFKIGVLSHAVVAIGPMDLRNVAYIDTGEVLENGVTVKLPRVQALRKLFLKWSALVRVAMFRKYSDLLNRIEIKAEASFQFDPSDLDTEIKRLEERLEELKEAHDENLASLETEASKLVKDIAAEDERKQQGQPVPEPIPPDDDVTEEPVPEEVEPPVVAPAPVVSAPPPPQAPVEVPGPRRSSIPQAAARPQREREAAPQVQIQPVTPQQQAPKYAVAGMDVADSFVDMGDPSSMDDAIHAENIRMMQRRTALQRGEIVPNPTPAMSDQVRRSRQAPHLAARQDQGMDDGVSDETRHIKRSVDGIEAYPLNQPEELVVRPMATPGATPKKPVMQANNPNFQPPKKM